MSSFVVDGVAEADEEREEPVDIIVTDDGVFVGLAFLVIVAVVVVLVSVPDNGAACAVRASVRE